MECIKPQTKIRYVQRMEPVLRWLASHPDTDADLYHLADLACLSPYHFHRVYRGLMGETVNATVQRLRMHRAAIALANTQAPLQKVALRAGYESDAAFIRAFGAAYGLSPGQCRALHADSSTPQDSTMYPVAIETFPHTTLATLSHRGDYQEIGSLFIRVDMLAGSLGLMRPESAGFGVYFDDAEQVPVEQLRSLAGVSVASDAVLGDELQRFEIPECRCAVLTHTGPYNELDKAYQWMFAEWLPNSGVEPADFPMFEQYVNDPQRTPPSELQTRIYLPLK